MTNAQPLDTPRFRDERVTLLHGDALSVLRTLPDQSVNACVTSPPYYRLRDYKEPDQIGQESTPDEYIARLVDVFTQVRRVLTHDGTLWINLADSYVHSSKSGPQGTTGERAGRTYTAADAGGWSGMPDKNIIGLSWKLAFALQETGWILRNDVIWHKTNGMPESVKDRLTTTYEHVLFLTKNTQRRIGEKFMPAVDAAWLAAVIDTHGAVTFTNAQGETSLTISNLSGAMLDKAARLTGQQLLSADQEDTSATIHVTGDQALAVLECVKPYLTATADQARVALAAETLTQHSPTAARQAKLTQLLSAMRTLNAGAPVSSEVVPLLGEPKIRPHRYWFGLDSIRQPHVSPKTGRSSTFSRDTKEALVPGQSGSQHRSSRERVAAHHPLGRNPGDVWPLPTQPGPGSHEAVMPLGLADRCVLAGCRPDGVVLDPFSGTGTTGLAAERHGRRYIGIDINSSYVDLSLHTRLLQPGLEIGASDAA